MMARTKRKLAAITAAVLPVIVAAAAVVLLFSTTIVTFQEGAQAFGNPRQGFYVQVEADDLGRIGRVRQDGIRLILLAYNLNGYQDRPLDREKLTELDAALHTAASQKVHIIFRAAYGFREDWDTVEPQEAALLLEHIEQIAQVLNRHANRILCVQAGMLGPWGEWHSSRFLNGSESEQAAMRNRVAAAWLDALDPIIPLQLRRPLFIRQAVEAGMPLERFGLHNDALLGGDTDMGTYDNKESREMELEWIGLNLSHGRNGGEMPVVCDYTAADNAVREFRLLRLTYLNSHYNTDVLESWKSQIYQDENACDYIIRHLGSRLYLSEARMPCRIMKHGDFRRISLTLRNTGFAPPQPDLCCYLAVRQNGKVAYLPMGDVADLIEGDAIALTFKLDALPPLRPDAGFELGIWIGYGHPETGGDAYALANNEDEVLGQEGDVLYFSGYAPALTGWKHLRHSV